MRSGPTADFVEDEIPTGRARTKTAQRETMCRAGARRRLGLGIRRSFFFSRVYYNIVEFLLFYFMLRCLLYYYK